VNDSRSSEANPLISIVVPVLNMERTIERALTSIVRQSYPHKEIILVDGKSSDGTLQRVRAFESHISVVISEPDTGVYHAINKGLQHASGQIVGILNADDYYAHEHVFEAYRERFADPTIGIVFGDLEFFSPHNPDRVVRTYSSRNFTLEKLRLGIMPPHPTTFVRRSVYDTVGNYSTEFRIAGDFEFLVRALWVHSVAFARIDSVLVRMQYGGMSTGGIGATYRLNKEIIRACRQNGLRTSWAALLLKLPQRLAEFLPLLKNGTPQGR
jgi:glycosyltransferase involved in cell wall biosynthesis